MKRKWMLLLVMFFVISAAQAQDETPITDEELKKYALVMDFADQEKLKLKESYNAMIQAEELMAGGKRFKELKGAAGNEVKLAELKVTPEELDVFNKIEAFNNQNIAAFKEAYTEKIKDKEQLGAGLYNRINKALKSDDELKTRYATILESVKSERADLQEQEADDDSSEGR